MTYAEIVGWGKCLPPAELTNDDLSSFMETSDEWIRSRTGIAARRISHVHTSDLAEQAARQAIAAADISADQIDLIIIATASPDTLVPNIASKVQRQLGAINAASMDVNAACTGFVYCLELATRMIQGGAYKHALVIGAERLSFLLDWSQRDTAVLFGDGAGAVVLRETDEPLGLQQSQLGCDAEGRDILAIPNFGSAMDRFDQNNGYFDFNFVGREIFKRAVKGMCGAAQTVMAREGWNQDDIDIVIPHQANKRIIEALCQQMDVPQEKAFVNIENYGNTSAATVPIALCEALEQGRIKPGDKILTAAFGAGLTWASALIRWGQRVTPLKQTDAQLAPCEQTALQLLADAVKYCYERPDGI
ncbi:MULTISPECIES: ketoacyl-ACP synthase III [Corallincola]|uniref:Beta-ketoacyl-[acyl-carrier-protein] synthase III n=2 Tax=Corallincola TaxID=1775176 RepID=A0ABY1WV62_9GAMM|nr:MULTISPECIES: ketoacyl-ACP synthase III [Corallincola]TAA48628.1 ketoacyl-ACP synthase III [Corallincola spongiicola]TCI05513.1 ketoacyl-ACP synthase III [Corallincola luteus]